MFKVFLSFNKVRIIYYFCFNISLVGIEVLEFWVYLFFYSGVLKTVGEGFFRFFFVFSYLYRWK